MPITRCTTHPAIRPTGLVARAGQVLLPNVLVLEFHGCHVPWWGDLVQGPQPVIKDGYITVPDGPGLGVELNEDVARPPQAGRGLLRGVACIPDHGEFVEDTSGRPIMYPEADEYHDGASAYDHHHSCVGSGDSGG